MGLSMTAQTGILLEHCKAAIFIEAKITDFSTVAQSCKDLVKATEALQQQYPDAHLYSIVAFGNDAWRKLSNQVDHRIKIFYAIRQRQFSSTGNAE